MRIARLDPANDDQIEKFWAAGKEADGYGRDYPTYPDLASMRYQIKVADPYKDDVRLVAWERDQALGAVTVSMPTQDNMRTAFVSVLVPPANRRRGIGSALLDAAVQVCRANARTILQGWVSVPNAEHASGDADFATHHGFTPASNDRHRVLDLPVASHLLDGLEVRAAPYHQAYTIETFHDVRPEAVAQGWADLLSIFVSEAPTGDLDIEDEIWTIDRLRFMEARHRERGRAASCAAAVASDGTVAALTEIFVDRSMPEAMMQGTTIVDPSHRGHRLGLAIKVANLRAAQQRFEAATVVHTWNAEVNEHMIAINDAMGFRVVENVVEVQRVLGR